MNFKPSVIENGINAVFAVAMAELLAARRLAPGIMDAMYQIMSSSSHEKLAWLGPVAGVRQWIGEIDAEEVSSYDYTIKNLDWQASTVVFENDLSDDQTGTIQRIGRSLAQRIALHPEDLAIDLLINGDEDDAYDGVKYFSNVTGKRTFDNLLAGGGTTLAQLEADLNKSQVAMSRFPDDKGRPLNAQGNMIVCPVELRRDFERLTLSDTDASAAIQGVRNPYQGLIVVSSPLLSVDDANSWYLLATAGEIKPLIYSLRQQVQNRMHLNSGTKTWTYIADYRGNGGYGLPHFAVKVVN